MSYLLIDIRIRLLSYFVRALLMYYTPKISSVIVCIYESYVSVPLPIPAASVIMCICELYVLVPLPIPATSAQALVFAYTISGHTLGGRQI